MLERLQKVMAEFGVASRRKCEELITSGAVRVNGIAVTTLGFKVDKEKDLIEVGGTLLKPAEKKVYILLNKPVGYITSAKDQFGRPTVLDLVKEVHDRVFPVGRLDYDTEGLLILTNDGELTYRITHPKHQVNKTYTAVVTGIMDSRDITAFQEGLAVEDYVTAPAKLEILKTLKHSTVVNITIHEGRNRQVRKMCAAVGHPVKSLTRIRIGQIRLDGLERGTYRHLTEPEVQYLYSLGGEQNDQD